MPGAFKDEPNYYNTARGAATQEIGGQIYSPNATVHVMPLRADKKCLEEFCQKYLKNNFYRFEPWDSCVFLLTGNYEMSPETNVMGWWAGRNLQFLVPVNWYKLNKDGKKELLTRAMVLPFIFESSSIQAISLRNFLGLPAVSASLESPRGTWMGEPDAAEKRLLTLKTRVFPVLNLGQQAEERVLLEIYREEPTLPYPPSSEINAKKKGPQDFLREFVQAMGQSIMLKQFRDSAYPDHACYQSIVQQRIISHSLSSGDTEGPLDVSIHRYPDQPIVKVLGLEVERTERVGEVPVDHLRSIGSFWMRNVTATFDLGKDLCWRAGTEQWQQGWIPDPSYFKGDGLPRLKLGEVEEYEEKPEPVLKPKSSRRRRGS